MTKTVITCDRCGQPIGYDENTDKLIGGDRFMVPTVSATGIIISDARQVELCRRCIWELMMFITHSK